MAQSNAHPWLDLFWRRAILVGACAVWAIVELAAGTMFWFTMAAALTVYGAYVYLYDYTPSNAPKTTNEEN